jgi:hypothetical protein
MFSVDATESLLSPQNTACQTLTPNVCADFLAGANLDNGAPETLLFSLVRFFKFLPKEQRREFLEGLSEKVS